MLELCHGSYAAHVSVVGALQRALHAFDAAVNATVNAVDFELELELESGSNAERRQMREPLLLQLQPAVSNEIKHVVHDGRGTKPLQRQQEQQP